MELIKDLPEIFEQFEQQKQQSFLEVKDRKSTRLNSSHSK